MRWLLLSWIVVTSCLLSWLFGFHMVAFRALAPESKPLQAEPVWGVVTSHFLSAKCGCSEKVIRHLIKRGPLPKAHETVYLIDGSNDLRKELERSGFPVQTLSSENAFDWHKIVAVPFLRVVKDSREIYAGAYGKDQKHSPVYHDEEIINAAIVGIAKDALPVFGCANSKFMTSKLDILGIKYGQK